MLKLLPYLKGYRVKTILGPLFKLVEAILELLVPVVVAKIIDEAIPAGRAGDYSLLTKYGVYMLTLAAVGLLFALVAQYFASRASMGFGTNLRKGLYEHINTLSQADVDKFGAPSLMTRLVGDTTQCQQGVAMFIRLVTRAPFVVIGSIIMAITIAPKLSLIFIGASLLIAIILYFIMSHSFRAYGVARGLLDDVSLSVRENLNGVRVIRAFSRGDREKAEFNRKNDKMTAISIAIGNVSNLTNPASYAIINIAVILVLWLGGKQVYYGNLSQGSIIALVNYLTQIMIALAVLANLVVTFSRASASAKRINEVFATPSSRLGGDGAAPDYSAPAIEVKNLAFTYAGNSKSTLSGINFTIEKGQTLGIVGGTGSGKSTLVQLIAGLYDVTDGEINLFGHPVSQYTAAEKNALIGFAMQKSVLFSGTIKSNLLWRKPTASDDELIAAIKTAQAYEFVSKKPGGLDEPVVEGGNNFSGGQKQRLNVARALVGKPDILILDDSSSALDFATDAALRKSLREDCKGMTTVVISQRATSMQAMDLILVMDDGAIVGAGTHSELLASCPEYREIYNSQVAEEDRV
ncbi:MAG: ABC transporter ATP-binding protein [Firmicutes bacterium]|nr:ABC transporter ATP-binding protein [Bacillota bacterium]